jgi:hypothetical protein
MKCKKVQMVPEMPRDQSDSKGCSEQCEPKRASVIGRNRLVTLFADSVFVGAGASREAAALGPPRHAPLCTRRTHALAPNNLPRTIHRLDSANKVMSCAVFFFNPR